MVAQSMYERAYLDVERVLDRYLGTEEEDGAGAGIVADVELLGAQRDDARALLRLFVEDEHTPCRFGVDGMCREHSPTAHPCPVAAARRLLGLDGAS